VVATIFRVNLKAFLLQSTNRKEERRRKIYFNFWVCEPENERSPSNLLEKHLRQGACGQSSLSKRQVIVETVGEKKKKGRDVGSRPPT